MKITSRAPTRIDLAGGTVDLWPLYLFLPEPKTINLAINLYAETSLIHFPLHTPSSGPPSTLVFEFISDDQNAQGKFVAADLLSEDEPQIHPGLVLHFKLTRYFLLTHPEVLKRKESVTLRTSAKSPAGAGLGGSSALCVSIVGALAKWVGKPIQINQQGIKYIDLVRDIETTVIKVPAGMQDYYGAMFGGLQKISWQPGSNTKAQYPNYLLPELKKRIRLFYSGQSRNSGINNWLLFKSFIDGDIEVQKKFKELNIATQHLASALENQNWDKVRLAIGQEWGARRTLASGISTPEIDRAFQTVFELSNQNVAMKICGAGGGGCFFVYEPTANLELQDKITQSLETQGMQYLPFEICPNGLDVHS